MNKETKNMNYLQERKRKQKFANRMTIGLGSLLAIFAYLYQQIELQENLAEIEMDYWNSRD